MQLNHVVISFLDDKSVETSMLLITVHLLHLIHWIVEQKTEMDFVEIVAEITIPHTEDSIVAILAVSPELSLLRCLGNAVPECLIIFPVVSLPLLLSPGVAQF